MNVIESLKSALTALGSNKLRAALTMLGIIIGVAAVVALSAIGEGVGSVVTDQIQSLGSNMIGVMPMRPRDSTRPAVLTTADAEALADPFNAPAIVAVAPTVGGDLSVSYGDQKDTISVTGVNEHMFAVSSLEMAMGGFLTAADVEDRARVAVLGWDAYTKLFPNNEYPLDRTINIEGTRFRVVGVLKAKGGMGMGGSADEVIYVPITTAHARLYPRRTLSGEYQLSALRVMVADESLNDAAKSQITAVLRERHNLDPKDEDDFFIMSQQDALEASSQITGILTTFLSVIAGISLLVGGIGIMNIMLVTVTERTREIGIRKAVGATRGAILTQFLIEALVLTLGGGAIGIALGAAGSSLAAQLMNMAARVTPTMVTLATGVSAAVGLIFGVYPAMRAARLHPIQALRYE